MQQKIEVYTSLQAIQPIKEKINLEREDGWEIKHMVVTEPFLPAARGFEGSKGAMLVVFQKPNKKKYYPIQPL